MWKRYSYRDFGIIAEPYFDVDFGEVLYLTDTGRRWDDKPWPWVKELVWQNVKNIIKRYFYVRR